MEQITLKANINECTVENWQNNTGEYNARVMNVEMCEDLCSCARQFVTFELKDGTVYESLVVDGKAKIPFIKEPQFIKIGLYAETINGDECEKRYSAHPASEYVNMGSYNGRAERTHVPTPGDYSSLLELIENMGTGSNINLIYDIDLEAEYGEDDAPSMNALVNILLMIGENFATTEYVNKVKEDVNAVNERLTTHIQYQDSVNQVFIEKLNALNENMAIVNEISILVGGAG